MTAAGAYCFTLGGSIEWRSVKKVDAQFESLVHRLDTLLLLDLLQNLKKHPSDNGVAVATHCSACASA